MDAWRQQEVVAVTGNEKVMKRVKETPTAGRGKLYFTIFSRVGSDLELMCKNGLAWANPWCVYVFIIMYFSQLPWNDVRNKTWKYLIIQYFQVSRLLSILNSNCLEGRERKWVRDFMSIYLQWISCSQRFISHKKSYIFPILQMTNVRVGQIRKCAQSFTAGKWENAHSKPRFTRTDRYHAAWMFTQMWITEMLEIQLCSLQNGRLKSFGWWLAVAEMTKQSIPPNSHAHIPW